LNITVDEFLNEKFDYILDARSPREFKESHIPGAINFYVLNDEQHQEVGYIYKQVSKDKAKKKGLIYVLENITGHLKNFEFKKNAKILVYCARGGERSESLHTILPKLNLKVYKLEGGYKAYRKKVVRFFENFPDYKFIVLRGNSGCGKTELLKYLNPSVDLEGLANHYGSMFGSRGEQPSQKQFENELFEILRKIPLNEYIFIEGESPKIGKIQIPGSLIKRMKEGIQIEIKAPFDMRVERILRYYGNINKEEFLTNLEKIKKYISTEIYQQLCDLYEKGELKKVAEILLEKYYDKVYKKRISNYQIINDDLKKCVNELMEIKEKLKN
jgi:tRNA 2-selenouridine synthase